MTRSARRTLLFIILLVLFPTGTRDQAWAHAVLLESFPADGGVLVEPPPRIWLRFSSKLEKALCRLTLILEDGRRIDLLKDPQQENASPGELRIRLRPLPPGAYILRFTVFATDGHTTEGVVRFRIATPR